MDGIATINGLDITSMAVKSNYGTFFATLKPWDQRKGPGMSADDLTKKVMAVTMMQPEAVVLGFSPPPISGMSTTGGFEGYIQMRGDGTIYDWKGGQRGGGRGYGQRPTARPSIRPSAACRTSFPPARPSSTPIWTASAARTWA